MAVNQPTNTYIAETATLTWIINNFSRKYDQYEEVMSSQIFCSSERSLNKFYLNIFPKPKLANFEHDILVYLFYASIEKKLNVHCELSILNGDMEKCFTKEFTWNYRDGINSYRYVTNFILSDYLFNPSNRLMTDDKLTIHCEVNVLDDKFTSNPTRISLDFCQDYQNLLESTDLSDVLFVVGGGDGGCKEFRAHKAILAARSSVFMAMFRNNLKEQKNNRVDISDIEVDVFERLLRYIYTGQIYEHVNECAMELFVAADKYQLDHLKGACEHSLRTSLNIESVSSILLLADMHNAAQLKSKCIELITDNSIEVMATDGWTQIKSKPDLLVELLKAISLKTK